MDPIDFYFPPPSFEIGGPGFSGGNVDVDPNLGAGSFGQNDINFGGYPNAGGSSGTPFDLSKFLPKDMEKFLGAIGQIAGGAAMKKTGQQNEAQRMADWQAMLRANRPNQSTPFGSVEWTQDPKTGNWTQTSKLSPELQERLGSFNEIAKARMANAQGMQLPTGGIDYGRLGLGNIAKAANLTNPQSADPRAGMPSAPSPYDMGGGMLNQYYQRGMDQVGFNPLTGR